MNETARQHLTEVSFGLTNYYGGESPLLIYILALIIASGIAALLYRLWRQRRDRQLFWEICARKRLSSTEITHLTTYMKRFHVRDPLPAVQNDIDFEHLLDRVSHYLHARAVPDNALTEEARLFHSVRKKLSFEQSFEHGPVTSSRALPGGLPVLISYLDRATRETRYLASSIISNNDMHLCVQPELEGVDRQLLSRNGIRIDVKFFGPNGDAYRFDSRFLRATNSPEPMWILAHSQKISREPAQKKQVSGMVMMLNGEQDADFPIEFSYLSPYDCIFDDLRLSQVLHPETTALLTFSVDGTPITATVRILHQFDSSPRRYHALFTGLDTHTWQLLQTHSIAQSKNSNGAHKP